MRVGSVDLPPPKRLGWGQFFLRFGIFLTLTGCTAAATLLVGLYVYFAPSIPVFDAFEDYQPKIGSRIYSVDNQLIGEFALERRVLVPPERVPPLLYRAFMSAEDKRFYQHGGLDYVGIVQAIFDKVRHPREKLRGASTITQQVAKSLLATHESYESATERSANRKIREAILARHLEHTLSKDQILYVYAMQTYLGHKAYGVGAAAEHYFRKSVWELSLAEMATLAGLPQRPTDYSPFMRPKAAWARRKYVLRRMHEDGYITEVQMREASEEELTVYPREELYLEMAPYYTEQVRRELVERFGERAVLQDGLKVYTAVDLEAQAYAQKAIDRGLLELDKRQGYRGALLNLDTPQLRTSFTSRYKALLEKDDGKFKTFKSDQRYLAQVTSLWPDGKAAQIDIAGLSGVLPLAAVRWARNPNPMERMEAHFVKDMRKILHVGDVIWVRAVSYGELDKDPTAEPEMRAVPRNANLFTLEQDPIAQGALVSVDPSTGYVSVQIGGYDFDESSYNRAVQACREPGSAFKPVVYSAAIDKYDYTASTLIDDKPLIYDDPDHASRWKPNNAGEKFRGRLPMRTCLKDSINTPAIRIADAVGIDDVLKNARRLGISTKLKRELGTALGSSCTTMMELMNMYVTLNQYGQRRELKFIRRIEDRYGNILFDASAPSDPTSDIASRLERGFAKIAQSPRVALDEATAFLMVSLLKNVVEYGTAMGASHIGQIIAGKTGTTNDSYDAWFMGFTRKMVTGVWVGHDRKERPLGINEQGGRTALPIWVYYTQDVLMDYTQSPPKRIVHGDFIPPEGVVQISIDPETGLLPRPNALHSVKEWYRQGSEPTDYTPDKSVINAAEVDMYKADAPL